MVVTLRRWIDASRRFEGTCRLYLQFLGDELSDLKQ
jgi:hypothetical protein